MSITQPGSVPEPEAFGRPFRPAAQYLDLARHGLARGPDPEQPDCRAEALGCTCIAAVAEKSPDEHAPGCRRHGGPFARVPYPLKLAHPCHEATGHAAIGHEASGPGDPGQGRCRWAVDGRPSCYGAVSAHHLPRFHPDHRRLLGLVLHAEGQMVRVRRYYRATHSSTEEGVLRPCTGEPLQGCRSWISEGQRREQQPVVGWPPWNPRRLACWSCSGPTTKKRSCRGRMVLSRPACCRS